MSNNGVPLRSELRVIQGHWKWHHSIDYVRLSISLPLCIAERYSSDAIILPLIVWYVSISIQFHTSSSGKGKVYRLIRWCVTVKVVQAHSMSSKSVPIESPYAFVFVNYRTQLVPEIVFSGRIRVVKPGEVATGSTESSDVVVVKETFDTLRERVIRAAVLLR